MRKSSWKKQRNTYNRISREVLSLAIKEQVINALNACVLEIEQFHSIAYPKCQGGCPSEYAVRLAGKALASLK